MSEGTFFTETLLTMDRDNVVLVGCGRDVTKLEIGTGLQFGVKIDGSRISLEDMWLWAIDGDNGTFALGTHLVECAENGLSHLSFRRLRLEHARNGLRWNGNKNIVVDDIHCKDLGGNSIGTMGGSCGRPENVTIRNVKLENCEMTGITLNPVKNAVISDVLIVNNVPEGRGRIDISSCVYPTENVAISNVVAVNASLLESAVNIDGAAAHPSNVVITNCVSTGYHGFPGIQGAFEDLTLSNCTFQSDQARAINIVKCLRLMMANIEADAGGWDDETPYQYTVNLEDTPGAIIDGLMVIGSPNNTSGCLFFNGADMRVDNAILKSSKRHAVYVSGARAVFRGCRFENNDQNGIWVAADDGTISECVFKGNSQAQAGSYHDITVPGFGGWRVHGNRFYSEQVGYHYNESSPDGAACMVRENFFGSVPNVRIQKEGTIVEDNF